MPALNESPIASKTLPLEYRDSVMSLNSQRTRKAVWHRTALMMAAWVEIIVGASFLLVPNAQSQLVFGAIPEEVGVYFARLAGIGLICLGIACLPPNLAGTSRLAVRALLIFNIGATILFAWIGVATTFRGVVLWPVVILHAVIAIALALSLKKESWCLILPIAEVV